MDRVKGSKLSRQLATCYTDLGLMPGKKAYAIVKASDVMVAVD